MKSRSTLIGVAFVGASLALWGMAGCGKKQPSCDAVFEHVKGLAPLEMRDVFDGGRDQFVGKCENLTVEQRRCILTTSDLSEVANCKRK
jgi:hypothetical protein